MLRVNFFASRELDSRFVLTFLPRIEMLVKIQLIFYNWKAAKLSLLRLQRALCQHIHGENRTSAQCSCVANRTVFCNFVRFLMEEKSFGREVNALLNHPALNKHIHLTRDSHKAR